MVQDLNPLAEKASRRGSPSRPVFAVFLCLMLLSCGRKGAPTLKSFDKPEKPSLLSAMHRENVIILKWDFPREKEETISGFVVLESSSEGYGKELRVMPGERSVRLTDFREGRTYRYGILAKSLKGVLSDESNTLSIIPLNTPQPPVDLSFSVADDTLLLRWKDRGNGILYNVYRRFDKDVYGLTPVNPTPLAGNSFTDVFSIDKKVYYTVRSLLNKETRDEGPPSEEVEINPHEFVPPAPENIGYFAAPDRVFLFWNAVELRWVTGYRVYRRDAGKDYTLIGETQIPSFLDNEKPLTKRDYRISARGLTKEGPAAEIKDVRYLPPEEPTMP
jgi:hypothetical protein